MQLKQFQGLITNMPVRCQVFRSKRITWTPYERHEKVGPALQRIFNNMDTVTLSRDDVFKLAQSNDLATFIVGTFIWGYPRGGRGKNFLNLVQDFDNLITLLNQTSERGIAKWEEHFAAVDRIRGVGLSTYTKFLYFLRIRVEDMTALIFDQRIIKVINDKIFIDLDPLYKVPKCKPERKYPEYLFCMHNVASDIGVTAEALELFLFEFSKKSTKSG